MLRRFRGSSSETNSDSSSSRHYHGRDTNNSKDHRDTNHKNSSNNSNNNNNNGSMNNSEYQEAYHDDEEETMLIRLSLHQMAIGSVDTLRGKELDQVIPHPSSWREQPPLIVGPRGQEETTVWLKGLIRKGIPPALRCAMWLSNVIQTVHPHQEPAYWREYRTLAKVRALDHAYESVLEQIVSVPSSGDHSNTTDHPSNMDDDDVWKTFPVPSFGQSTSSSSISFAASAPWLGDVTMSGHLSKARVLMALNRVIGLSYAPLVPSLTTLLLTAMSESYVFCAIREMTHAGCYCYFPVSRREQVAWCRAFVDVFTKLHKATAQYLEDRDVLEVDHLTPIFQDFFIGILPLTYVLRILDIYTLEGGKVLFRFGTALFVLYKLYSAEQLITISTAAEWWDGLRSWAHSDQFQFDVVVRKAYGLHGKGIRRQLRFPRRAILERIIKMEEERIIAQGGDENDDYNDQDDEPPAQPLGLVQPEPALPTSVNQETVKPILAQSTMNRLHLAEWLPLALRMTNLELLYSTNYHGRSLEMFYQRVKSAKHTILICEAYPIRDHVADSGGPAASSSTASSSHVSSQPAIIGMYASQAWRISTQIYGDGGCFLFRLEPNAKCWKWSLKNQSHGNESHSSAAHFIDTLDLEHSANAGDDFDEHGKDSDVNNNETALLEQFMVGTRTYISMGGNKDGSAGLRLNEDLTRGESSKAAGYDNDALHEVNNNGGSVGSSVFEVGLVEVYGLVRQIDGKTAIS